jgi:hypothetical protein
VAESEEQPTENAPDWPAVFDAWVDARVAAAIAEHQSVVSELAAAFVEFSTTVQKRLDAIEAI